MFSLPLLYKLRNQQPEDDPAFVQPPSTKQEEDPNTPSSPIMNSQKSDPLSTTRDQLLKALGSVGHGKATSAYQSALSEQPKMEDYNPSTVQKVLGALGGFAGGFTGRDINAGEKIIDAPYNRATKQFQSKISGLKDSAALEHGQEIEQVKALGEEEGILHGQASEDSMNRRLDQADKKAEAQRLVDEAKQRVAEANSASDRMRAEADMRRAEAMMVKATNGGGSPKKLSEVSRVMEDGTHKIVRMTDGSEEDLGLIAPTGQEKTRTDQANIVSNSIDDIEEQLKDPEISSWMGGTKGGVANLAEAHPIGASIVNSIIPTGHKIPTDKLHGLKSSLTSLDSSLAILHGYRGGPQVHRIFSEALGQFERNPKAMTNALEKLRLFLQNVQATTEPGIHSEPKPSGTRLKTPGGKDVEVSY